MLSNILDIDNKSMKFSLLHERGALILFDFEAAFPSISRYYLLRMLHLLGLPSCVIQVVSALYHKCACWKIQGLPSRASTLPVVSDRDVRFPFSFCVFVVDIVLRQLQRVTQGRDLVRAFADDIGMAIQSVDLSLPNLIDAFAQFALFSGLKLNFIKTIFIPLWYENRTESRPKSRKFTKWDITLPLMTMASTWASLLALVATATNVKKGC